MGQIAERNIARALSLCPGIDVGDLSELVQTQNNPALKASNFRPEDMLSHPSANIRGEVIIEGRDNLITIGAGARLLGPKISIKGERCRIIIGPNTKIRKCSVQLEGDDCLVVIGAGTTWEGGAAICHAGKAIVIGNDCMLSSNVVIRTHDGHGIWSNKTGELLNRPADVSVGHHVWLGSASRVSKGSAIGMGVVLAQCAVASGKLDPECIYGGVPARKIQSDIHWTRRTFIDELPSQYRVPASASSVIATQQRTPSQLPEGIMLRAASALKSRAYSLMIGAAGGIGTYLVFEF